MAAIASNYTLPGRYIDSDGVAWATTATAYAYTVYTCSREYSKEYIAVLERKRKREYRASQDRKILRFVSALQSSQAKMEIRKRFPFALLLPTMKPRYCGRRTRV